MISKVVRQKTQASLQAIWTKFEQEVQRQQRATPGALFEKLLTKSVDAHSARLVVHRPGRPLPPPAAPRRAPAEDDSDGPPELVGASDDDDSSGPPSLYASDSEEDEGEDSDAPPPLYDASSGEDDPDMPDLESEDDSDDGYSDDMRFAPTPAPRPQRRPVLPARRPPRARPDRAVHHQPTPEPQPGPSHSARQRRPEVDLSGLRPDHEFGTLEVCAPPRPRGTRRGESGGRRRRRGRRRVIDYLRRSSPG